MTRLRALSTLSPETPYAFILGTVLVVAVSPSSSPKSGLSRL